MNVKTNKWFVMKYYGRLKLKVLIMSQRLDISWRKKLSQFISPGSIYTLYHNSKNLKVNQSFI